MVKTLNSIFVKCLSVFLALIMFSISPLTVIANAQENEKKYVKDVIFIYGENLNDAKKQVPDGYTMLDTDLNQGAAYLFAVDDVYLAYSTTTNPDEAITDIKMMNMNGGFVLSDYEEQIANVSDNIKEMADQLASAVDVFVKNYRAGTPGAKAAYFTLSAFTVDEADGISLADYFIYGNVPSSFYLKLILNAHKDIIATILSALTMAIQGEKGDTWLDRLSKIDDPYSIYDDAYWDQASALWSHFYSFYETYDSIDHDLFRTGNGEIKLPTGSDTEVGSDVSSSTGESNLANAGMELLYEVAYAALESYYFGDGTPLSEWLVCDDLYEEMLYPLIEVLTPAEYAMMNLCGPLYMILATAMSEDVYNDYMSRAQGIIDEMGSCSIWHGVNTELFKSSIGITDEANRAIAETKAEQDFNNDGDSGSDDTVKLAGLIASAGAISLGVGIVTLSFTAGSLAAVFTGATASSFAVAAAIGGALAIAAGVVLVCVALVMVVVYIVVWLKQWYDEHHPEYTDIPEYMYDLVVDENENRQFVLYEVAKTPDGKPVDVNAWEGKEWHAPYISRDPAAGNPIEADFEIKLGDGTVDDGFAALAAFGGTHCENLNRYADDDEVGGIFVSYRQEPLTGDFARGKYLSDIRLFVDADAEECKRKVKNQKYTLYNLNLTPDSDKFTYIGYKTTNRSNLALTDIRTVDNYSSVQYSAGISETYAASGTVGSVTLYTTRISMFGSPILSDFLVTNERSAPAGYEPANMFSGGPAVNLNVDSNDLTGVDKSFYLYFLPSKAYTGGVEYLGGIASIFDIPRGQFTNEEGSVEKAAEELGYKTLASMSGSYDSEGAILYTVTYNPYRAIYGISAVSNGDYMGSSFTQNLKNEQMQHSLATRYLVTHDERVVFGGTTRKNDTRIYTAGVCRNAAPLKVSDLIASADESFSKDGFIPLSPCLVDSGRPANLSAGFNFTVRFGPNGRTSRDMTMSPMYLFVRKAEKVEGNYLTNLYISSKEGVLNGLAIDCDQLDNSYVMSSLAALGAETVIGKNLNLEDSDNATYLAYKKDKSSRTPITDVILYYAGSTDDEPKAKIVKNNITYHLVGDTNLFCPENGEEKNCKRVYLYYTTNPSAGSKILDIKIDNNPILNGWETVRTQNGKALYDDMDKFESDMWFIHIKRQGEEAKQYISDVFIGWGSKEEAFAMLLAAGCDYFLDKDLNDNCGAASDYVYLGYKKTSDVSLAIRDLRTTHDDNVKSFTKNGFLYTKINGNLNSYTNIFADDIYLYYTKDAEAGYPLVDLETSSSGKSSESDGIIKSTVVNQYNKNSDLNDGALGSYIYLIMSKAVPENDTYQTASIIGEGSLAAIIMLSVVSIVCASVILVVQKKGRANKKSDFEGIN